MVDHGSQCMVCKGQAKNTSESTAKQKRRITDEELTNVLKEWAFAKNPNRVNVMREGRTWVWSSQAKKTSDSAARQKRNETEAFGLQDSQAKYDAVTPSADMQPMHGGSASSSERGD